MIFFINFEMAEIKPKDYKNRSYLSATESSKFLGISVESLHRLANRKIIKAEIAASGQMRFDLRELKKYEANFNLKSNEQRNAAAFAVISEQLAEPRYFVALGCYHSSFPGGHIFCGVFCGVEGEATRGPEPAHSLALVLCTVSLRAVLN